MYNIMHNSKSGMMATQSNIDLISNNITNVQTVGYKKLESGFLDLYQETLHRDSYPTNSDKVSNGTGSRISKETRNYAQGTLKTTGISTNLAIDGDGFFRVLKSNGSYAYTRNGEFNLDSSGKLVDNSGNILDIQSLSNNIRNLNLKNGDLSINKSGEVYLDKNKVGNINLYRPKGDGDFISVGDNLFIAQPSNVEVVQNPNMVQGYVEMSNVDMKNEMVDLIMAQRAFQYNSKGIKAVDDMWSMVNNLQSR